MFTERKVTTLQATSFDSRPEPPVLHLLIEPGTQRLASVDHTDSYVEYTDTDIHLVMLPPATDGRGAYDGRTDGARGRYPAR